MDILLTFKRSSQIILALSCFVIAGFLNFALVGYGFTAAVVACVGLIILAFMLLEILRNRGKPWAEPTRIALIIILIVAALAIIALEVPIIFDASTDDDAEATYVIVLGAGLNGSAPSLSLQERLIAAAEYLAQYPDSIAVVSGGQGAGEDISEAEAMRRWLENSGIAPDRIIMEDKSTSTKENLSFSLELILEREDGEMPEKLAIVSSEYHLCRAKMIARDLGIEPRGVAAKTSLTFIRINYFFREAFALALYLVFG